jgi:hypothetical protein
VMPFVSIERSVVYRERFAGMYSPWAYSFAQVLLITWRLLVSDKLYYTYVQTLTYLFVR